MTTVGCGESNRSQVPDPPPPTFVNTPDGELEIIGIPVLGDPAPLIDLDKGSRFTDDPVADYLRAGGPTSIPFFNVENGRLVSMGTETSPSVAMFYGFAVAVDEDRDLGDLVEAVRAPIEQRFPDGETTEIGPVETGGRLTSSVGAIKIRSNNRRDSVSVSVTRDSGYPAIAFIHFLVWLHPEPAPVVVGEPIAELLAPGFAATGLDSSDVTSISWYEGWTTQTQWGPGLSAEPLERRIHTGPLRAQVYLDAGSATPDDVRAQLEALLNGDWNRDDMTVTIKPSRDDPNRTVVVVELHPPGYGRTT